MTKKINLKFIFLCFLIAFFVIFAGVSIFMMAKIYGITSSNYNQIIFIALACAVLVFIFSFSARMVYKNDKPPRENTDKSLNSSESEIHTKIEAIKAERAAKEKLNGSNSDSVAETAAKRNWQFSVKKLLLSIVVLLGFVGISAAIFYFGTRDISNIKKKNYIKTTATIEFLIDTNDTSRPYYAFTSDSGELMHVEADATFGGTTLLAGKEVTLYYNANNPEIFTTLGSAPLLIFMGTCFLLVGILVSFGIIFGEPTFIIPFAFAYPFIGFIVALFVGLHRMTGLSFTEMLFSGAFGYVGTCLFIVGLILLTLGIVQIPSVIKDIRLDILSHKQIKALGKNSTAENADAAPKKEKKVFKFKNHFFLFIFVGLGFFASSIAMMVMLVIVPLVKASKYQPVTATVIDVRTYEDEEGSLLASYTYEYYVDDTRYEKESSYSESANLAPEIGEEITIKINPNDPEDVLDSLFFNYIVLGAGAVCLVVAVVVIYLGYRSCLEPRHDSESYGEKFKLEPKTDFYPERQEGETTSDENFNK